MSGCGDYRELGCQRIGDYWSEADFQKTKTRGEMANAPFQGCVKGRHFRDVRQVNPNLLKRAEDKKRINYQLFNLDLLKKPHWRETRQKGQG